MHRRGAIALALALALGCGGGAMPDDAGTPDARQDMGAEQPAPDLAQGDLPTDAADEGPAADLGDDGDGPPADLTADLPPDLPPLEGSGTCEDPYIARLGLNAASTQGGMDEASSVCLGKNQKDVTFLFTPEQDGLLVITLVAEVDLGVYTRASCNGQPLACVDAEKGGIDEVLYQQVSAGNPIYVTVDGYDAKGSPEVSGPFTLDLAYAP